MATDYRTNTGNAGRIIIRDHGQVVEFLIECDDLATFAGSVGWSGVVNGTGVGGSVSLPSGFRSKVVASYTVTTTQRVTFHMNATGTGGLGGPADVAADINRTPPVTPVPPGPPVPLGFSNVSTTSFNYLWRYGELGTGAVTSRGCQWSLTEAFTPGTVSDVFGVDESGTVPFAGLTPGVLYYVRVRVQTTVGVGPWSPVTSQRTLGGVYVSDGAAWKPAEVNVSDGAAWKPGTVAVSDGSTWRPTA